MKKTLITIVVTILACFCVVGTTFAWLIDSTATITNTFTFGDVDIDLVETTGTEYKTIPGATIEKDPKVTVTSTSEACYVFVKIEEVNNTFTTAGGATEKVVDYAIGAGWTPLDAVTGVYYLTWTKDSATTEYPVFANNQVTINGAITKGDLANLDNAKPALKITAYAVQKDNVVDVATAWNIANGTNS